MILDELVPYYESLTVDEKNKLDHLYNIFRKDFVTNDLFIDKKRVIIKNFPSWLYGYTEYCESFVHIITRKSELKGKREFVSERANRIHWIRPILENRTDSRIKYFQFIEADGSIRDYYWYKEMDFMVVLEKITNDMLLITAFVVDEYEVKRFERRLAHYLVSLK